MNEMYVEWLAQRLADELARRGVIEDDQREGVRRELVELVEAEGWRYAPPSDLTHL